MFRPLRYVPAAMLAVTLGATASSCATQGGLYRYPTASRADEQAYERGFVIGSRQGEADARRNDRSDYGRHAEYRSADNGYGYGNRDDYRRLFRQGFIEGYNEGYRRLARAGGRVFGQDGGRGRAVLRDNTRLTSLAAANGYRDGYDQGRDDARKRRAFDPVRAPRYRSANHDYERRYGSLDAYKQDYRAAFQRGYAQGYRGNQ